MQKTWLWALAVTFSVVSLAGRLEETPDFLQTNPALPGGGDQLCAASATSNSLLWLAKNGFPQLDPGSPVNLVGTLAGPTYINTDIKHGSAPADLARGVKKYVTEKGYTIETLKLWGWRPRPKDLDFGGETFRTEALAKEFSGKTVGWVNVGWYKKSAQGWERHAGHWVTLLEISPDGKLAVVDPAPRAGTDRKVHWLTLERLTAGTLSGKNDNLPRPAHDLYRVTDGLEIKNKMDAGILDGVVILKLKEKIS